MVHASPQAFRSSITEEQGPRNVPMDGATIHQMRDQFIGEYRGLKELSRMLTQRKHDLEEKVNPKDKHNE